MPLPITIAIVLLFLLAAGAIAGGDCILRDPRGTFLKMSPRDLEGSPFSDFLIPGLFLVIVLGFGSALAALLLWRMPGQFSWFFAAGISIALLVWLAVQVAMIGYRGFLQPLYACWALSLLGLLLTPAARAYGGAAFL